jgi:hypothetical protein
MIFTLAASLFVSANTASSPIVSMPAQAVAPPKGAMCVQSKYENGDYVRYVVPATRVDELRSKAQSKNRNFEIVPCPVTWTPATTAKLCAAIDGFSDNLKSAMAEIYGVSPDEMCQAAKDVDALQKT